jgi:hypothetical protein
MRYGCTYLRVFFKRRLLDHHQDILKLERGSSEELTRHDTGLVVVEFVRLFVAVVVLLLLLLTVMYCKSAH